MKVAGVISNSLANGPKLRYVLFLQGCPHKCDGCQNQHTWGYDGGKDMSVEEVLKDIEKSMPLINGVTISGGEPFEQPEELYNLLLELTITHPSLNVWIYTGYKYEELLDKDNEYIKGILSCTNVLVDGQFQKDKMQNALKFTGSRNQRIIHLTRGQVEHIIEIQE